MEDIDWFKKGGNTFPQWDNVVFCLNAVSRQEPVTRLYAEKNDQAIYPKN